MGNSESEKVLYAYTHKKSSYWDQENSEKPVIIVNIQWTEHEYNSVNMWNKNQEETWCVTI